MLIETIEILLSFLLLPLAVLLTTLISCGSSRPKPQPKRVSNPSKMSARKTNIGSNKIQKLAKSIETESTKSSKSQSSKSTSRSRQMRKHHPMRIRHIKGSQTSGSQSEKSTGRSPQNMEFRERRQDLKMEPTELRWDTNGGMQKVFITNSTNKRHAIKVKCSDNSLYRVNPVYSFVEPGQVLGIDVMRQNGGAKVDKMANKDQQNPRMVFQDNKPKPMMVLPLIATDSDNINKPICVNA